MTKSYIKKAHEIKIDENHFPSISRRNIVFRHKNGLLESREFTFISVFGIDAAFFGEGVWPSLDDACKVLKAFVKAHPETYYYARPEEYFFIWEAAELAAQEGKSVIILDNMS